MDINFYFGLGGVVLLVLSIFVAQAADGERNKVLFNIANVMTLVGALALLGSIVKGYFFG